MYGGAFIAVPPPWALLAVHDFAAVPKSFDAGTLADNGIVVRFVRGERCLSPGELHQEWGAAWWFPERLSHRWDAFADEITDMGWLHARNYLTVVTQAHRLYEDAPTRDLAALGALLADAATYWANPVAHPFTWHPFAIPFHIVFQCEPKHAAKTRAWLQAAGTVAPNLFAPT